MWQMSWILPNGYFDLCKTFDTLIELHKWASKFNDPYAWRKIGKGSKV